MNLGISQEIALKSKAAATTEEEAKVEIMVKEA